MGKILLKYYQFIITEKGSDGKTELSKLTKISSIVVPLIPDSPENIELFKDAVKKITGKNPPDFSETAL
jgi:hypothetical protein